MNFLIRAFSNLFDNVAKTRTARELLKMTDSRLKDVGLSRFKLEQGASAYPWKLDTVTNLSKAKTPKVAPVMAMEEEKVAA